MKIVAAEMHFMRTIIRISFGNYFPILQLEQLINKHIKRRISTKNFILDYIHERRL